jgi:hypothetical protein
MGENRHVTPFYFCTFSGETLIQTERVLSVKGKSSWLNRRSRLGANEDERQKKEKTCRETTAIKVWVTPAEKAAITVKGLAQQRYVKSHRNLS